MDLVRFIDYRAKINDVESVEKFLSDFSKITDDRIL